QLVLGDRGRLAAQLDDRADLFGGVDEEADAALGGLAAGGLVLCFLVLFAEGLDGLLHVAAGLAQGRLALYPLKAGAVAQLHHVGGIGFHLTNSCCSKTICPHHRSPTRQRGNDPPSLARRAATSVVASSSDSALDAAGRRRRPGRASVAG